VTGPRIPGFPYLQHLGSGGFAAVYLYEQEWPQQKVAVKVVRPDVALTEREKSLFTGEANAMARLADHPYIVSVITAGVTDGRPYLVMRYCPPPDLGVRVRTAPMSTADAISTGIKIASANLLNFFNTFTGCRFGTAGGPADCRGASDTIEYQRQLAKEVASLRFLDADVIGYMLKISAGSYSFECANPRHEHEYHLFERIKVPEGKVVCPGMITHASNIVEHPELIAERIMRFAKLVGRENVIAAADCGFSSQALYRTEVHHTVVWEKFKAMRQGADLATRQLWGKL
jgi:hypothetical protein